MTDAFLVALFTPISEGMQLWRDVLGEKVHLRVGNRPLALGRESALAELSLLLARAESIGGQYREVWTVNGALLVETEIVARDRFHTRLPCAVIFRRDDRPEAVDVRFYLDPGPLKVLWPESEERSTYPGNGITYN